VTAPTIRDERACGAVFEAEAVAASVAALRHSAVATLRRWHVPDETVEMVELLTSELVTNAVEHSQHSAAYVGGVPGSDPNATVWIRVRICGQAVVLEVWDGDPTPPLPREADVHDERGRGLLLLSALAQRCGYYWPSIGGKVVWAQVSTA
jgi:anti-sigma regulatory factor (Ser/Thr protein kinase)